jgi:PAS domain S-box-containing protein
MAVKAKYSKQLYEGMSILDLAPPERHADLKKLYLRVLSGKDERTEASFTLPDETIVCYENLFTPAYDTEGNVLGIVIRSTNISEKKQTVALIQEAEERWRFALDASNQAAWDWNMQTNEVIYSGSYKRLYGFERDELKNNLSDWEQRIHPEDRKRMEGAIEEHIASDNPYYESTYRLQVKNGDYKWIMARGKLLSKDSEGNPLRMIGTHTDLTESIKMQLDLKTMAERFTYAAKASAQALWEWNPVTGKAYVSQSFTELFGWAADPDHRFEQWHSYIHPDDKKQTVSNYYTALEKPDATIWQAEYRFQKQDGAYATVSDRAYILRDDTGKAIKVIGATQDITALQNHFPGLPYQFMVVNNYQANRTIHICI